MFIWFSISNALHVIYRSPQRWSEDTIKLFLVMIYTLLLGYRLRTKLQEKNTTVIKFKSSSQNIARHTFMLKRSSKLLMWCRNVYDVTDIERRMDAGGYISALTSVRESEEFYNRLSNQIGGNISIISRL
jgi:hypothetical protein